MIASNFLNLITKFFAPPYCAYCKTFLSNETIFCEACFSAIKPIVSMKLAITKSQTISVFAVSGYQDPLKRLILAKGWSKQLASTHMADVIWQKTLLPHLSCDFFIPIPLHWTRFAWRGYNQAELMAARLAVLSGKRMINALSRKKMTQSQFRLGSNDRVLNLENVFSCNEGYKNCLRGKHIILVDDLMTTGATLKSAAKVLFECQPASISAVVTCRVI
jgi:ComF family protein